MDKSLSSQNPLKTLLPYLLLIVALASTLGSLFFGEVLKYPPCTLCWYQRICMYPLVIIFISALWTEDRNYLKYTLPLSISGLIIAGYHVLLYHGWIENIVPCSQGVSCTTKQIELLGFITIPLMSFVGFSLINILSILDLLLKEQAHAKK